ncbi:DarT ssDNA thymidine ADP-ribosyltransferase family protein [Streptococcus sanguinis]|jgi:conserved uncharacterized protein|uniref:Conserved uncharacterized protein n=1 Tax=Streptococcus sanguinis (strain SK36) TaxID=388919 RepID=A3CQ10_STRSV|nr:DarT ssDNA thymidine ADP-ribosyltransferase family protein [Streptococcus sanguinis]ABN45265.1 Conserved uncharacterized protein [Streptococcus sanguinis SK36]MBZ2056207.1 DUF4433 domain-containing protein [Streptococcus sanguinis]
MPYNNPYDLITKSRQIHRLCHFTHVSNLSNILKNGIFSSRSIPRDQWNDSDRVDGYIDYVCTSVELPNSYCLKNMVRKTQTNIEEWIIFKINPYIIDDTSLFCPLNAAKECGKYVSEGVEAYESIFLNEGRTRNPKWISSVPSNLQAEVLIKGIIPINQIKGVIFHENFVDDDIFKLVNQANIEIRQSTDLFDSEKTLKWLNCGRVPYDFPINFNDYRE